MGLCFELPLSNLYLQIKSLVFYNTKLFSWVLSFLQKPKAVKYRNIFHAIFIEHILIPAQWIPCGILLQYSECLAQALQFLRLNLTLRCRYSQLEFSKSHKLVKLKFPQIKIQVEFKAAIQLHEFEFIWTSLVFYLFKFQLSSLLSTLWISPADL